MQAIGRQNCARFGVTNSDPTLRKSIIKSLAYHGLVNHKLFKGRCGFGFITTVDAHTFKHHSGALGVGEVRHIMFFEYLYAGFDLHFAHEAGQHRQVNLASDLSYDLSCLSYIGQGLGSENDQYAVDVGVGSNMFDGETVPVGARIAEHINWVGCTGGVGKELLQSSDTLRIEASQTQSGTLDCVGSQYARATGVGNNGNAITLQGWQITEGTRVIE